MQDSTQTITFAAVEGALKGYKDRINNVLSNPGSQDTSALSYVDKVKQLSDIASNLNDLQELVWLWKQKGDFKFKSTEKLYKTVEKVIKEYTKLQSLA
jgi:hypothetical protein